LTHQSSIVNICNPELNKLTASVDLRNILTANVYKNEDVDEDFIEQPGPDIATKRSVRFEDQIHIQKKSLEQPE